MSFGEWAAHQVKKSKQYTNKPANPYESTFSKKSSEDSLISELNAIVSEIQSSYSNTPSLYRIKSSIVKATTEITNLRRDVVDLLKKLETFSDLQKENSRLQQRVDQLLQENNTICDQLAEDFEKHKNDIEINFDNEVVLIDGDLATQVVHFAVKDYIIGALTRAMNNFDTHKE